MRTDDMSKKSREVQTERTGRKPIIEPEGGGTSVTDVNASKRSETLEFRRDDATEKGVTGKPVTNVTR